MKKKEYRSVAIEKRTDPTSRRVEGYAALFEVESKLLGGFCIERIARTAFDKVVDSSDVMCLLNHDQSRGILARHRPGGEGTLTLKVDEKGLRYSFEAPNTALGDELLEGLRRGDISESSFAFVVEEDTWEERDGVYYRTILKVRKLYDVSPVFEPAYAGTEVGIRSATETRELVLSLADHLRGIVRSDDPANDEEDERNDGDTDLDEEDERNDGDTDLDEEDERNDGDTDLDEEDERNDDDADLDDEDERSDDDADLDDEDERSDDDTDTDEEDERNDDDTDTDEEDERNDDDTDTDEEDERKKNHRGIAKTPEVKHVCGLRDMIG